MDDAPHHQADAEAGPVRLHAERLALPGLPTAGGDGDSSRHDAVAAAAGTLVRAGRRGVVALAGDWAGGGGVVTADPREVRRAGTATAAFAVTDEIPPLAGPARAGAVGGGWFGHLGFGLSHALWRRPPPSPATRLLPLAHWAWHDWVLRLDSAGHWWFEALLGPGFDRARAGGVLAGLRRDLAAAPGPAGPVRARVLAAPDVSRHTAAVEACVRAIRHGDVFQANITSGVDLELDGAPVDAWRRLVTALAPARAAFVDVGEGALVGSSPELFLERRGGTVRSSPIKGTRGAGEGEARVLRDSAKDAAENVMIVDLVRNDLSAVCVPGTVAVTGLVEVAPHAGVWHLVSTVEGELAPGTTNAAMLGATFPPASVTGVPKVRALEVMADAEGEPRGVYTGAVGFASPVAGLELAVAIRTLEVVDGLARLGVGGGVTAGSTPVEEWAECLVKAAPLLAALGAAPPVGLSEAAPADAGLAETVLVRDGHVLELADHVERLERSWWELYRERPPLDVREELRAAAAGLSPGWHRVSLEVSRNSGARTSSVAVPPPSRPAADPGAEVRVRTVGPGGLARHAFAGRPGAGTGSDVQLLVDPDGVVLQATGANVLAIVGGVVWTPPLDGRILPGVTRAVVLDLAVDAGVPVRTARLPLAVARDADGVLLVDGLHGVRWVRSGLGRTWAGPDAVGAALADALLDRWGALAGARAMLTPCG